MSVTIYDVAKEAGVSISTVSKSFSDSFTIPDGTKKRVLEVAKRLEYRPNVRAKNFARKSTGTVLFLTELYTNIAFENPHLFEIFCGLVTQLEKKGYSVLLKSTTKSTLVSYLTQAIGEHSVDGILIHANILSEKSESFLAKCDFPYLVIGKSDSKANICWVDVNHEQAGEEAGKYLLDCGYRNIAFLLGSEDSLAQSRILGLEHALDEEELAVQLVHCRSNVRVDEKTLEELFLQENPPEVLLCSNNHLALQCMQYAKRKKKKIPQELAILTFDNYPFSSITEPKLSAIDVDMNDLGQNAALIILQRMKKPQFFMQSYCTSPKIIERETTDSAKREKENSV